MSPQATDAALPGGDASIDLDSAALDAVRLGVYGGSFDPPHAGHLWVAERARERFALEHVLFVPARRSPHKLSQALASDGDRLALLSLLLSGSSWASIWPGELRRQGPSFTVDSLIELRDGLARTGTLEREFFLLLGSDNLPGLASWKRIEHLLQLAQPIILSRTGTPLDVSVLTDLGDEAAEQIARGFLELDPMDASATEIRSALASRTDPGPAFPASLLEYARARGLYGASTSAR